MGIFKFLGSLLGIGGDWLKNKQETKRLQVQQKHEIIKAETEAAVNRIKSNTESDNEIDMITARNKRYTLKDEVLTYLFLIPVAVATFTPFLIAYQHNDWAELNALIRNSYRSLEELPDFYRWVLYAIIVDVLGFRSFARKIVDKWKNSKK